jgi:uncharacterized membrane protein
MVSFLYLNFRYWGNNLRQASIMKAKYILLFLFCVLALAASEYLFLSELNNHQRFFILLLTTVMAIASIVAIFLCYKRLERSI